MKALLSALLVVAGFLAMIAAALYILGTMGLVDNNLVQTIVAQALHRLF